MTYNHRLLLLQRIYETEDVANQVQLRVFSDLCRPVSLPIAAVFSSSTSLLSPLCALVLVNPPRPSAASLPAFGEGMPVLWSERPIRRAD
jgi:hypothetical protein